MSDARQFLADNGLFLVHDDGTVTNLHLVPNACFAGPSNVVGCKLNLTPGVYMTVPDQQADDQRRAVAVLVAGQPYADCREQIDTIDWDGWYPEVDIDGDLTGEIADLHSTEHEIVDVTPDGVVAWPGATDAMVLWSEQPEDED